MYEKRNVIYAEPGCMLVRGGEAAFQMAGVRMADVSEIGCPVKGVKVKGSTAEWGGVRVRLPATLSYAAVKARLVKLRYSNDDQLAILCNGETAEVAMMQRWRAWAGEAARAICARVGVEA